MKNLTQKEACFLILANKKNTYFPAYHFVGEKEIKYHGHIKRWVFLSYKAPARLSELYNELYPSIKRISISGKSGTKYYSYAFNCDDINTLPEKYRKLL